MSTEPRELTDSQPAVDNTDAEEVVTTVEIQLRWTYVFAAMFVLFGVILALGLGIWLARSRASAGGTAQAVPALPGQVPAVPQAIPMRSRSVPLAPGAQSPRRSSAGISTSIGRTPNVGDPAPDFTLKNLKGEQVSLSDFKGQPVLINFWATWCPPCRYEMPFIESAWQQYKDEGFVVLAVDVEEPISVVQRFVDNFGLTFPILLDYKGEVSDLYRLRAFPTSYFVGRDGKIVIAHRGMMTEQVLQQYMQRVMATKAE